MSNKQAKKLRKNVRAQLQKEYDEINTKAVFEAFRKHINGYPLKIRLKICWRILRKVF